MSPDRRPQRRSFKAAAVLACLLSALPVSATTAAPPAAPAGRSQILADFGSYSAATGPATDHFRRSHILAGDFGGVFASTTSVSSSISGSYLDWPAKGRITQRYGCTGYYTNSRVGSCRNFHTGIDIANAKWTRIRAAASGYVRFVGREPWGAWMVVIRHRNGLVTRYAHLVPTRVRGVRKGLHVRRGQVIGYMGKSGMATGVHLHFGVLRKGDFTNPARFLPPHGT